jgi:DNA-binding IclR family transcriptional regulator
MATTEDIDRYRAPALDKGLDILELLAGIEGGLTQAEISKALNRTPNEFYRMLDRLVRRGYVSRAEGDRFELTLKLFGLAHLHAPIRRLVALAAPQMRELAQRSMQANHLAIYDKSGVTVIAQVDSPGYWGISIRVGARISLFNTGSGHILLAFRSSGEREMMIAEHEFQPEDADHPENLGERLEQIRTRGYEIMPSLQTSGVYNLSAPILAADGHAVAALTCPYITPMNRPKAPDMPATIEMVAEVAARISAMVGGVTAETEADDVSQA